jgi:primosomal protein N' (replication factor Y)
MVIARVALNVPLDKLFDYEASDAQPDDIGCRAEVPFGRRHMVGVIVELASGTDLPSDKLRPIRRILRDTPPLPADWRALVLACSRYYQHPLGETLAVALPPALRRAEAVPKPNADPLFRITEAGTEARTRLRPGSLASRSLSFLVERGPVRASALKAALPKAAAALRHLSAKGLIETATPAASPAAAQAPVALPEQSAAVEAISGSLGRYQTFLLHGVTGSGKTEVYLVAIERALARASQALMLVPEIALTPQLENRVRTRFPGARIACLHSGMAEGARAGGFIAAANGELDIVLGTRLAVFTPLPRLGLIVVDEEQDPSFKQQDGIRYCARDVAVLRAQQAAVPIVLGSATPSLETFQHARSGRYRLLELPRRALAKSLPSVRCIDTRNAKLQEGLSEPLLAALESTLRRAEQSLIFLNRRGYAPVLACPACGWVSGCEHCSANMVLHLADRVLRCHHCGAQSGVPASCPTCGNQDIHPYGRGTQRVESALRERFPTARVLRVDRDSASTPGKSQALLESIHRGEVDVLVGTQILAKGHDFPRLTLVGVLNADASLHAVDFRAPERLFAQLMQVGGRSGRADLEGEVLIQTEHPDHPLYTALAGHDYHGFATAQLAERQQAGFPPFMFHAILRAEASQLARSLEFLQTAAALGGQLGQAAVTIYDPVPMRLTRRARVERAQLLVESPQRPRLQSFLRAWIAQIYAQRAPAGVRWSIDVDPHEF